MNRADRRRLRHLRFYFWDSVVYSPSGLILRARRRVKKTPSKKARRRAT